MAGQHGTFEFNAIEHGQNLSPRRSAEYTVLLEGKGALEAPNPRRVMP